EAPVEAEEEHGSPLRRGCARRLYPGFRHRKGQQEISEKRRVGIRGVQLRSRIGQVHGRSQKPLRLRTRVPHGREGEGLHLPSVPEALNRYGVLLFAFVQYTNRFQVSPEDGVLASLFARDYAEYCARVRRWLSKIGNSLESRRRGKG